MSDLKVTKEPIAIIGMGCRFPTANSPDEFWELIRNGVDTIADMPKDRPISMESLGGFLAGMDKFDASFFKISDEEAVKVDPQHRLLLETTWEALEDAGLIPANLANTDTGVFIGLSGSEYLKLLGKDLAFEASTGTLECMVANRISSYFSFQGPSLAINTACSSALVAVDRACNSLWNREVDLGLAGGTNLIFSPVINSRFTNAGLLSKDSRCRTFDAKADGYVRGEGIGVVVLKLLSQAQADGDRIYAVIRGSGINHNGRGNGLTAPSMQAQIALLSKTYQQADVNPSSIHYIEAHGTATLIGDALEMKALGTVVGQGRTPDNPCRVGCVKTNIGHTEAASGIAGLIKVALSLYHRQIPANLHFQEPNPAIPFTKLGLKVQQILERMPEEVDLIRAGVSAFGLGGTNAHVILESVPSQVKVEPNLAPLHIFTLTAKTPTALQSLAQRYQTFLEDNPEVTLSDICFTVNTRRSQFQHRLAIITKSKSQLEEQLNNCLNGQLYPEIFSGKVSRKKSTLVCFIFSGKTNLIRPLIKFFLQRRLLKLNSFWDSIERVIIHSTGRSVLELIDKVNSGDTQLIDFVCEYAIAKLLEHWNVKPTILMSSGAGNYAALAAAGVLTLEDIVSLIVNNQDFSFLQNFQSPNVSIVSSKTGNIIKANQSLSPEEWKNEFNNSQLLELPHPFLDLDSILLDLSTFQIKDCEYTAKTDISDPFDPCRFLYTTLIELWLTGIQVNWAKIENYQQCYPVSLPTYPFDRKSYWINLPSALLSNLNNSISERAPKQQTVLDSKVLEKPGRQNKILSQSDTLDISVLSDYIAPQNELESQLTRVWEKVLGMQSIGIKDNFFSLGGDSLLAIELLSQVEKTFQKKLPLATIFHAPTIAELAPALGHQAEPLPWSALIPIQTEGSRPPLFSIHWLNCKDLSRYLGPDQPIYGLHFSGEGVGDDRPTVSTVEELARLYLEEMLRFQPQEPYLLMGHSFGGLVAYEMAQQLVAQGRQVALLALVDTYTYIENSRKLLPLRQRYINLLRVTPAEVLRRIKEKVKTASNHFMRQVYPIDTIDIIPLWKAYTPKSYTGRVDFFMAVPPKGWISIRYTRALPRFIWRELVHGKLEVYEITGTHTDILQEPKVQILAKKLKACINEVLLTVIGNAST